MNPTRFVQAPRSDELQWGPDGRLCTSETGAFIPVAYHIHIFMKTYPCSSIAEYEWLVRHPQLREQISNSNPDDRQALQAAIKLVELHVLKRLPYRSNSAKLVAALYRQGVDQAALATALAYAWLNEKDEFEVQLESRWWDLRSTWMRLLVSLLRMPNQPMYSALI
eukprot:Opistho-1_new@46722